MHIAHSPAELRGLISDAGCVATIGNFDGVHLGHQALIRKTVEGARALGLPSVALTFDPHPSQVLTGCGPLALCNTRQRLERIAAESADAALVLPFTRVFAALSSRDFCRETLALALNTRILYVGYDFRLGRDQAGAEELAAYGREFAVGGQGFEVRRVDAVLMEGEPVSSTRIRRCLRQGELEPARIMLGRPYAVRSTVIHGAGRGGPVLGVPTANMDVTGAVMPHPAIYATSARLVDAEGTGPFFRSITSFGRNPTFGGGRLTLETHILDFHGDIYGRELEVAFVGRLREEKKFSGPEELIRQLHMDMEQRRALPEL